MRQIVDRAKPVIGPSGVACGIEPGQPFFQRWLMKRFWVSLLLTTAMLVAGCSSLRKPSTARAGPTPPKAPEGIFAEITTPRGLIVCELYFQKAPLTVKNFVGLAEGTLGPTPRRPYFDGHLFHRVVPEFVLQGGDPTGTGRGGPGYTFPDEFAAGLRHDIPGVLSMANSGPDTNGSQFFITLGEARYLDFVHSIFGRVIQGQEILPQITRNDAMQTVKIVRRGAAATRFKADEATFNAAVASASRARLPHLVDRTSGNPPGEYWLSKYIEYRLSNLARFTGRQIYVRLVDEFEPKEPGQTKDQFMSSLLASIHGRAGTIVAVHFADTDEWVLAGAPVGVTLPAIKPPKAPRAPATSPDATARERQRRIYDAAGQVISSLIDQTDPK